MGRYVARSTHSAGSIHYRGIKQRERIDPQEIFQISEDRLRCFEQLIAAQSSEHRLRREHRRKGLTMNRSSLVASIPAHGIPHRERVITEDSRGELTASDEIQGASPATTAAGSSQDRYAIAGGADGKRRLNLLAEIMRPTTLELFRLVGVAGGQVCVDIGCGGGHVTLDLARIVGPAGRAIGIDFDAAIIELAQQDQQAAGLTNVEFRVGDASTLDGGPYDVAYARFLLSHVAHPEQVVNRIAGTLRPGGTLIVEDIDVSGCFCHPDNAAYDRFLELYSQAVACGGGDANLGRRLPALLRSSRLRDVRWRVFQPVHADGPFKDIQRATMDKIRAAVLRHQLAIETEIDEIVAQMAMFAADPSTLVAMPRMVQAYGRVD
jgi:2-polyprenyl-3-methyl-5-hydroxy-6-metoxy-1,4-benzoquinol methylase